MVWRNDQVIFDVVFHNRVVLSSFQAVDVGGKVWSVTLIDHRVVTQVINLFRLCLSSNNFSLSSGYRLNVFAFRWSLLVLSPFGFQLQFFLCFNSGFRVLVVKFFSIVTQNLVDFNRFSHIASTHSPLGKLFTFFQHRLGLTFTNLSFSLSNFVVQNAFILISIKRCTKTVLSVVRVLAFLVNVLSLYAVIASKVRLVEQSVSLNKLLTQSASLFGLFDCRVCKLADGLVDDGLLLLISHVKLNVLCNRRQLSKFCKLVGRFQRQPIVFFSFFIDF